MCCIELDRFAGNHEQGEVLQNIFWSRKYVGRLGNKSIHQNKYTRHVHAGNHEIPQGEVSQNMFCLDGSQNLLGSGSTVSK